MEDLAEPLLVKGGNEESSLEEDGFYSVAEEENEDFEDALSPSSLRAIVANYSETDSPQDVEEQLNDPEYFGILCSILYRVFHTSFLPEVERLSVQIRFLKFLLVTVLGITATHSIVVAMNLEHRDGLHLADIWLYEGNSILLDCIVFFSVGRLWERNLGADHLAWILVVFLSSMYTSLLPEFAFLQHSVTLYEMHCTWPWKLWVFVFGFVLPACMATVVLHGRYAWRRGSFLEKLVEVVLTFALFLTPQVTNSRFEFHHWFAGLLFGMHANYDTWWSRATQAWCLGQYINGLAVWGRDPTLTCGYAFYISTRQHCTRLDNGTFWLDEESNDCWIGSSVADYDPPDWRHCGQ